MRDRASLFASCFFVSVSRSNVGESAIKELVVRGEYLVFHQPSNGKGPSTWHRHKGFYWFLTKSITRLARTFKKGHYN